MAGKNVVKTPSKGSKKAVAKGTDKKQRRKRRKETYAIYIDDSKVMLMLSTSMIAR